MFNLDINNRKDLQIDDFKFLQAFKEPGQPVFFRITQDSTRSFGKNENCIMMDTEEEYGFMRIVFKRYQNKGCGIFFVVNNGGQKGKDITSISAHFGDADFGKEIMGTDENGKEIVRYRTQDEIEKYKRNFLIQLQQFQLEVSVIVETKNGFHFYWLLEKDNQDLNAFKLIQKAIIQKFNTDQSIVDLNRILRIPNYLHLKNPSNPFKIKCIKFDPTLRYTQREIADILKCDLSKVENQIIEDYKENYGERNILKEKIPVFQGITDKVITNEQNGREFYNLDEIISYLRRQNMIEVLGIKVEPNTPFRCIFHDDHRPSAVIANNKGIYKYFCNSPLCICHNQNGLDLIDIVSKEKSIPFIEAVTHLCNKFSIEMPEVRWRKSQEKKYAQNFNSLQDNSGLKRYTSLNKIIRWGIRVLTEINQIGMDNITSEKFNFNGENVFFFSNRFLADRVRMNLKQVNQYINLFCILKLVNKVPKESIPGPLLENAKEIAKNTKQRMINFYTVPIWDEVAEEANQISQIMLENGYSSIKTISKAFIEDIFDETVANYVFRGSVASSYTKKLQDILEKFMVEEIIKKGYVILDDIYQKQVIIDGEIVERETKYINYKRLIPVLINKYNFQYRKANKDLLERFNLKGYSYVLYRISA